jgi:peptidoglycan/LPS O-acetylase OafA/YrhL
VSAESHKNASGSAFLHERLPELDGVRGLAIILVIVWHVVVSIDATPGSALAYVLKLFGLTWAGVDLFFVLSGYLICSILFDQRENKGFISAFFIRRAFRILPLYVLCVGAAYAAKELLGLHSNWLFTDMMPWWSYVTFTQNFAMAQQGGFGGNVLGITWSLAVEEQFYLLVPFLARWLTPSQFWRFGVGAIIVCNLVRVAMVHSGYVHADVAIYVLLPTRCDALIAGALVACAMRAPHVTKFTVASGSAINGCIVLLGALVFSMTTLSYSARAFALAHGGYTLIALFFALSLLIVVRGEWPQLTKWLQFRPLRSIGIVAFGLYLLHQPIRGLVHIALDLGTPKIANGFDVFATLLALVLTFVVAGTSWALIERPLIRLGRKVAQGEPASLIARSTR